VRARQSSQSARNARQHFAIPRNPVERRSVVPSTIAYSISGCAQPVALKSPRSQAERSERTKSRLADATDQVSPVGPASAGAIGLWALKRYAGVYGVLLSGRVRLR
jgi:hypothetical protein